MNADAFKNVQRGQWVKLGWKRWKRWMFTCWAVGSGESVAADAFAVDAMASSVAVVGARRCHFGRQRQADGHLLAHVVVVVERKEPAARLHRFR